MRLVNLQADGLKCLKDVSLRVPKLLALSGPNGAGKTAIQQTIRIAALDHDPDLGKTLAATRKVAGGRGDIEVGLTFDCGFGVRRSVGKSMTTEVAPPQGEETEAEKQQRINRETGAFMPSFDVASIFSLSAEKRRAALFALLPRSLANLDQDSYRHWLGYEDAADTVKKAIDKLWLERIIADESPTEGLASAIAFAREKFLEADRERLAQEKVVDAADRDAESLTGVVTEQSKDDLAALQAGLSIVEQALGRLREQKQASERTRRMIAEREQRLTALADRIMNGEVEVRRLLGLRDELSQPSPEALRQAEIAVTMVRESAAEALEAAEATAAHATEKASQARDAMTRALGELEPARGAVMEARRALAKLQDLPECPVCGSTDELERARDRLRAEVIEAEQREAELTQVYVEATAAYAPANTAVERARAQVAEARKEGEEELAAAHAMLSGRVAAAENARRASHEIRQAEQALADSRAALAEMQGGQIHAGDLPESFDPAIQEKEGQAFDFRERIAKLQEIAKAAGKAEAARERADQHRTNLQTLTDRASALKTLYGALQKYRGHVIETMVSPVETTANELLQRIDPAKTFRFIFEREGKDTFDLGFEQDGSFRSYDAASTGEAAFLAVVFVAALIAAVQPVWRVLLVDNAEAIDDMEGTHRRRDLMRAIARVSDSFDNVILSGACDFADVDGWEVVDVQALTGGLLAGVA